jgi:hypothetical protein
LTDWPGLIQIIPIYCSLNIYIKKSSIKYLFWVGLYNYQLLELLFLKIELKNIQKTCLFIFSNFKNIQNQQPKFSKQNKVVLKSCDSRCRSFLFKSSKKICERKHANWLVLFFVRKIKVYIYIYNSSIFHLYNNKKKWNLYENVRALHKSYTGSTLISNFITML